MGVVASQSAIRSGPLCKGLERRECVRESPLPSFCLSPQIGHRTTIQLLRSRQLISAIRAALRRVGCDDTLISSSYT